MARNRVIYQSEALYVSNDINSTTETAHAQLERVQSANYSFTINRQDINQYGQAARIDTIVMDSPTVSLDFSYYLTDGFNERALGFYVGTGTNATSGQFASGHMLQSPGKNFFITTVDEGEDAKGTNGNDIKGIIGLGNAFLSDYTLDLAVGSLPTVSVSMECANINSSVDAAISGTGDGISGIDNPAVDITNGQELTTNIVLPEYSTGLSQITALRPGDITVDITALDGVALSDLTGPDEEDAIHIQSVSLSVPLSRSPLQRLGTRFAYARTVDFPVNVTVSVNAICNDITAKNLATLLQETGGKDIVITLKGEDGTSSKMKYHLKGCRLDSESFSSSIGSNKSVDLTFSTQIGGTNDTDNGLFVSGANQSGVFS